MNLFAEAEQGFEALIALNTSSLEVYSEYAQSHFAKAEEKIGQRLFGRSKTHIQKGIELLARAHKIHPHVDVGINTLIGKGLNFAANLPVQLSFLDLPGSLIAEEDHEKETIVTLRQENLFLLASKFFESTVDSSSSANNNNNKDQSYYLMAENHFQRFNAMRLIGTTTDGKTSLDILQSAVTCIKLSIGLNPNRWEYWNLYGLLLSTDEIGEPSVAEEVFTLALEINKSSFTLWANLGTLYLKCQEVSAANRAFGK